MNQEASNNEVQGVEIEVLEKEVQARTTGRRATRAYEYEKNQRARNTDVQGCKINHFDDEAASLRCDRAKIDGPDTESWDTG